MPSCTDLFYLRRPCLACRHKLQPLWEALREQEEEEEAERARAAMQSALGTHSLHSSDLAALNASNGGDRSSAGQSGFGRSLSRGSKGLKRGTTLSKEQRQELLASILGGGAGGMGLNMVRTAATAIAAVSRLASRAASITSKGEGEGGGGGGDAAPAGAPAKAAGGGPGAAAEAADASQQYSQGVPAEASMGRASMASMGRRSSNLLGAPPNTAAPSSVGGYSRASINTSRHTSHAGAADDELLEEAEVGEEEGEEGRRSFREQRQQSSRLSATSAVLAVAGSGDGGLAATGAASYNIIHAKSAAALPRLSGDQGASDPAAASTGKGGPSVSAPQVALAAAAGVAGERDRDYGASRPRVVFSTQQQ